ncbi:RagB/SusD family nutrient uptake outer membrane protein [Chryseobacterium daecheongense]|uniref:Outer membrane starch-binding protein n=1 Tax=Chryseobacterium daecheongense TaxID=192389 RepID=A0A3N0VSH4_9FLAO|nr:RagB/SusD family nutrient uptake outer membrane protein [Chryseobacterium daecheongense]ROH95762.1 RagB/SusD family nutrient uptake outer membrane protein [Chryseobacterium daecheongense]TDX91852.1 putative outer membrane starch-binding protein [Chryseobacterium daecheongense]
MKKLVYISLIALAGLSSTSCSNDLLDTYAPGALTEDVAFQTSSDLRLLLNSVYAATSSRSEAEFVSVFTDECGIGVANGGQGLTDDYVFFLTPTSGGPSALWANMYVALARINRVLEYSKKITPVDADDAKVIARIKAEALTMRAYCHLVILSYFTTDMKSDSALAGIISDRIFAPEDNDRPRNTNGEFYAFIHSDLDQAISLYTANPAPGIDPTVANVNFTKGLKARAYAYKGDYTNAETWANQVISTSGVSLATKAQYQGVFFNESNGAAQEVIFKLKRTAQQNAQGTNLHNAWCSVRPNAAGSPFYEVSRALYNLVATNSANDVRFRTIVAPSSIVDPNYATSPTYRDSDVLVINKHGGVATGTATWATTGTNGNNNDFKIMRISEMYFIKAEARVAAGDLTGAAAAVKSVLDQRFGSSQTVTYPSATAAWKGILDQRRIEFAYEGYRFIDIKRLGTLANAGIDRHPADYSSSTSNFPGGNPANLPLNSYKWALPIPSLEINVNTAIQQNPGY